MLLAKDVAVELELGLNAELGAVLQLQVRHQLLVHPQVNGVFGLILDDALVRPPLSCRPHIIMRKKTRFNSSFRVTDELFAIISFLS